MRKAIAMRNAAGKQALCVVSSVLICLAASSAPCQTKEPASVSPPAVSAVGIHGGLCVQIGAADTLLIEELARTGRFIVQVLDPSPQLVDRFRRSLRQSGLSGLVSVDRLPAEGELPYTEDLVNLLVVRKGVIPKLQSTEMARILCPLGVALVEQGPSAERDPQSVRLTPIPAPASLPGWLALRKPWPAAMDGWTHPRHSAAGNPVSHDTLVAPPRRVRWVVGARSEVRGMVSAAGRNFYAGVLARDAFNGLRLWQRDLGNPTARGALVMKNLSPRQPTPVTNGPLLFVVEKKKLVALDGATGNVTREYPEAGTPGTVLHDEGILIVADAGTVRGLDVESARLLWKQALVEPRNVVAGEKTVALIHGQPRRGEKTEIVVLEKSTGKIRWRRDDYPWLGEVDRCVYHRGMLAYELSSLSDDGQGNAIHIVSATDGKVVLEYPFPPGMNHRRQARAMFIGELLWVLHGGRPGGHDTKRMPVQAWAIDVLTGHVRSTHSAGLTHCFPPVATTKYMLSGEMDLTNLATGYVDANRITKAACGYDVGWIPANGLIYATPKHCVCWPMLRGYTALAPERPQGGVADMKLDQVEFALEKGNAPAPAVPNGAKPTTDDWPMYRHDGWRSGSTRAKGPTALTTRWTADLSAPTVAGPINNDWQENPFVRGPITSPAILGNLLVVARPDAHEVVALDADTGQVRWRYIANGRVDTTPTLHRGLCLFGTKTGWVYCLRSDDGQLVWRLRAAPLEERIVAYGQIESPWPVPGSVLLVEEVAYFAAGRQSLADGGIFLFAVEPATGQIRWTRRLDSVPQKGFYECSGLEFDNFDLLHREGKGVAMSRWVFDRTDGKMSLDPWNAFAKLNTGQGSAWVPRGCWSYAPRHQRRIKSFTVHRPLTVFRDKVVLGAMQGLPTVYRRDFDLEGGEKFETRWMTGWAASQESREGKMPWRSHRLAEKASWKVDVFDAKSGQSIDAMVLAANRLYVAGSAGELRVLDTANGAVLNKQSIPAPLWDGMAVAGSRLYLATSQGSLLCLE